MAERVGRPFQPLRPVQSFGRTAECGVEGVPVESGEERLAVLPPPGGFLEIEDERVFNQALMDFLPQVLCIYSFVLRMVSVCNRLAP